MSEQLSFHKVSAEAEWPAWARREQVVEFIHQTMNPWQDSNEDIAGAMDYAMSSESRAGGFVMLAQHAGKLAGALVMLNTGMGGYVPEHLLLFVCIDPQLRGQGFGEKLLRCSLDECDGAVKLHVDFGNPAARLYERMGFIHCYNEMRLKP